MNNTIYSIDDRDYIYENFNRIETPKHTYETIRKAYYQSEVSKVSCSLHAAMTVISNNHDYMFNIDERNEILELAISQGFDPKRGWTALNAIKCVVSYCNDVLGMDLIYIRVLWKDYIKLAKKGFGIYCGYRNKLGMGKDMSDGVLGDDVEEYKDAKGGHQVSFWYYDKRKDQRELFTGETLGENEFGLVNNYFPKHSNNEAHITNLKELVESGTIFPDGYIVVPRNNAKGKTLQALKQRIRDFRKLFKK